jgi:hypothetical protein
MPIKPHKNVCAEYPLVSASFIEYAIRGDYGPIEKIMFQLIESKKAKKTHPDD